MLTLGGTDSGPGVFVHVNPGALVVDSGNLGSLPDSTPLPHAFMPNGEVVGAKSDTTMGVTSLVVYRVDR